MATNINENYFEYGVLKYFRGNAHLVAIGTYGQKKDPIGPKAYIDPQNTVLPQHLVGRVIKGPPIAIDFSRSSQTDVEANGVQVQVYGVALDVAGTFSYTRLKTATLRLMNFSIAEGPLMTMLNTDASGARNFLAGEGSDGRIVSEVWVVMEAALGDYFAGSGSITISAVGTDLKVTARHSTTSSESIVLTKGAVFAYKMHKVSDWNSGKTRIENMEADYKT